MRTPISPQWRFLLRGSGLLIAMLALWWWILIHPLLFGVRISTSAILWLMPGGRAAPGVVVESNGDWVLRLPIPESLARQDAVQRAYGRGPGAPLVKVRSFKLAVAERIPTFFTLSFPLFWAICLAAPRIRKLWRVLAIGTALLGVLSVLSLFVYAAQTIESNLKLVSSPAAIVIWNAVEYLNVNVAPYMAPLLIAVWLHNGLRDQIFSWNPAAEPAPAVPGPAEKTRRGRYRAR